ncbi:thermonuclease family protein [Sphingomonas sp. TX0522]|uniref:thermonuclease family protein n=1 Tax=Sphingomonas sp. TX0522 TaxID=2479205 RepID=UPI0018DF7315|nr:thermonuclease family protein [Sphingomonas sp. TX0522]MBI0530302.1 thermonuclease family protein [Sphingomonas sp. TX0522]
MNTLGRLALVITLNLALTANAETVTGRAVVVDGDTFDVRDARIRLWGIDAPERQQVCTDAQGRSWRCGDRAREALRSLLALGPVHCTARYRDRGARQVASCTVGGRDLARQLVAQGWALEDPRFSKGVFQGTQRQARDARLGIWTGRMTPPWQWRAHHQSRTNAEKAVNQRCRIKGNINAEGQRIAHAPEQRDYATVRINPARGERWFCTITAARSAGWRPADR